MNITSVIKPLTSEGEENSTEIELTRVDTLPRTTIILVLIMVYVMIDSQYVSHQHDKKSSKCWKTGHSSGIILVISMAIGFVF